MFVLTQCNDAAGNRLLGYRHDEPGRLVALDPWP